ncbi:MAG: hypothetical protein JOZ98_10260 [Solirubrobacterales bacterium]|nr:hypothetical protein [Solirubrobacterales bacterium]MBV9423284.1 hypothetical protein [Solirubrobacterales bacterium]MBV9799906.1 hypothetical protein [Solirubrobacterales bacterium]
MRRTTIGILAVGTLAVAGCGGKQFANNPRPPVPINLSVYIDDARVSVSPGAVGAGPVVFIVTNQASNAVSMSITRGGSSIADTGPINPQGTAQVTVNTTPGDYAVSSAIAGASEAQQVTAHTPRPAVLHIGPPRPSGSNQLLQP